MLVAQREIGAQLHEALPTAPIPSGARATRGGRLRTDPGRPQRRDLRREILVGRPAGARVARGDGVPVPRSALRHQRPASAVAPAGSSAGTHARGPACTYPAPLKVLEHAHQVDVEALHVDGPLHPRPRPAPAPGRWAGGSFAPARGAPVQRATRAALTPVHQTPLLPPTREQSRSRRS